MGENNTNSKQEFDKDLMSEVISKTISIENVKFDDVDNSIASKDVSIDIPVAQPGVPDSKVEEKSPLVSMKTEGNDTLDKLSLESLNKTIVSNEKASLESGAISVAIQETKSTHKKRGHPETPVSLCKFELPTIICTRDKSPREAEGATFNNSSVVIPNTLTKPGKHEISEDNDNYGEPLHDSLPPSPTALSPASSRLPSPTISDRYLSPDLTPHGSPRLSDRDHDDDTASIATQDEETSDPVREKRYTALKVLREIEVDFARLRQRLYREKVAELDREIDYINNDTDPSLVPLLKPIELKKRQRVAGADCLRNMQILTITNMCTAMEYQIHCEHQEKEKKLKYSITEGIGSKRIKLVQEWSMGEDTYHLDGHKQPGLKRKPRLRGTNLVTRKVAKSTPVASLEQSEIDQDLAILTGLRSF